MEGVNAAHSSPAASAPQEPPPHGASPQDRGPQGRAGSGHALSTAIIRVGVALFALGVLAIIVSFVAPLFDTRLSTYFYFAAMLCPLGMIVGVAGALVSGRRSRT